MRPVDADEMLKQLKPIDGEMENSAVLISDMSRILRNWVERQPTMEIEKELEHVKAERDAAVEELENYMVQDVVEGNEPCGICAKASAIPCECCDPKWRGIRNE